MKKKYNKNNKVDGLHVKKMQNQQHQKKSLKNLFLLQYNNQKELGEKEKPQLMLMQILKSRMVARKLKNSRKNPKEKVGEFDILSFIQRIVY